MSQFGHIVTVGQTNECPFGITLAAQSLFDFWILIQSSLHTWMRYSWYESYHNKKHHVSDPTSRHWLPYADVHNSLTAHDPDGDTAQHRHRFTRLVCITQSTGCQRSPTYISVSAGACPLRCTASTAQSNLELLPPHHFLSRTPSSKSLRTRLPIFAACTLGSGIDGIASWLDYYITLFNTIFHQLHVQHPLTSYAPPQSSSLSALYNTSSFGVICFVGVHTLRTRFGIYRRIWATC